MYHIPLHSVNVKSVELFYKLNFWQEENATKFTKIRCIFFFLLFSVGLFGCSLMGSVFCENKNESLFLGGLAASLGIHVVRSYYHYTKQKEFIWFLREICVHVATTEVLYQRILKKLNYFKVFVYTFLLFLAIAYLNILQIVVSIPLNKSTRLPFNVWFPLDVKANKISLFTALAYIFVATTYFVLGSSFNIIIWNIALNCSIKYETFGTRLQNLGVSHNLALKSSKRVTSAKLKCDIIDCIKTHLMIYK